MIDTLKNAEMVIVPLTGMAKIALPSKEERAAFIASLEQESEKIKNGQFTTFDKETFIGSMLADYDRRLEAK